MTPLIDSPLEPDAVLEGLDSFLLAEVHARHEEFQDLLDDPRQTYDSAGNFVEPVRELIRQVRIASANAGYYTMCVPETLGGGGLGHREMFLAWEHIFRRCGTREWLGHYTLAHWTKGPSVLLSRFQPKLLARLGPQLMTGEKSLCFAMSEPDAGSDVWKMRTRAERTEHGWILNGLKQWISNAAYADFAIVFAITDPELASTRKSGITAFLVPTDAPGFAVDAVIPMFGQIGSNEGMVSLADVFVQDGNILGELHSGLAIGLQGVSQGRIFNAARAVGLGRWALELAIEYTKNRHAFGGPISDYQGVSFPLADAAMDLHAGKLMALNCVDLLDRGLPALKELAMTKAFTTEAAFRALDSTIQAHGAMGFTNDLGIAEAWLDIRRARIADGSAEIMRRQIVKQLYRGDTEL